MSILRVYLVFELNFTKKMLLKFYYRNYNDYKWIINFIIALI